MFVSERDNGVRLAALNAIVVVYDLVGENVYKLIGPIADKDLRFGNGLWVWVYFSSSAALFRSASSEDPRRAAKERLKLRLSQPRFLLEAIE